jgi:spore coat polysaccharide biosynthesis protein SpsF
MGSTRLPGKVLRVIEGKPLLEHLVERIQLAKRLDSLVIATTHQHHDDPIQKLCEKLNITCYRGSEHDVLGRYVHAMGLVDADVVVRVTSDCPLIDPELIDFCVETFFEGEMDYVQATARGGFPRGFDVEVVSKDVLLQEYQENHTPEAREHVTLGIISNKHYKVKILTAQGDYAMPGWRICVDEDSDFRLVELIYRELYRNAPIPTKHVLRFLRDHPYLRMINQSVQQKPS